MSDLRLGWLILRGVLTTYRLTRGRDGRNLQRKPRLWLSFANRIHMASIPRKAKSASKKRVALTSDAVIEKGVELADRDGVDSLSMRRLAAELGVEAMSLYNHVANKDQLLNGMTELVWARVYVPRPNREWQTEIRLRYSSARTVILAHPWLVKVIESCRSGPLLLATTNSMLGCLRGAGFPVHLAYRALLVLDSYLYGFALQEVWWPHTRSELPQVVNEMLPQVPQDQYPHLVELMGYVACVTTGPSNGRGPWEYRAEFEFGLDLVIQGLNQALLREGNVKVVAPKSRSGSETSGKRSPAP